MRDEDKTRQQLIDELVELRQRIAELEKTEVDLKRTEEKLRDAEEESGAILDDIRDGVALFDRTGKLIRVNKRLLEIGGYQEEEVIGKRIGSLKMFSAGSIARGLAAFTKIVSGQEVAPIEVEGRTKAGKRVFGEIHGSLLRRRGKVVGVIAIVRDITERKQAEEALLSAKNNLETRVKERTAEMERANQALESEIREHRSTERALRSSEERLKLIFEFAPDPIYLNDLKGTFVDGNRAAEEVTGYKREELIGKNFLKLNLLPLQQIPKAAALLAKNAMGQSTGPDEFTLNRKDGTKVSVEISTYPVKFGHKSLVLGIARDISERKQAEEALEKAHDELELRVAERTTALRKANEQMQLEIKERKQAQEALQESEQRYRRLVEAMNEALAEVDENRLFTFVNDRFCEMLGYSRDEVIGRPPTDFLDEATKQIFEEQRASRKEGKHLRYELEFIAKDRHKVPVIVSAYRILDADGNHRSSVALLMDITERKRVEQEMQGLYKREIELRQSLEQEMKRRGEFTRALVHELKTPVTAILASSDLLVDESPEGPLLRLARNIQESTSKLDNRIGELLDLARGELGILKLNRRRVDPLEMLRGLAAEIDVVASSSEQSLVLDLPSSLPPVSVDEERLRGVVLNLLANAIKFTAKGGTITLAAREDNKNLIVEVKDTGPGIAPEDQKRIFEPYYRVETERGRPSGLGLGLALCKTWVELHRGKIWVDSEKGRGSTFGFSVPLFADAE